MQWLEPDERKPSCPVLRGGSGSNAASLPDNNWPQIRARRTRDICIEPMFKNFCINSNQRIRWLPCARIQNSIVCRRSSRQCIARLIRLRSTLHPPPGSGNFAFRISRTRGFSRQFNYLELSSILKVLTLRLKRRTINCNREHRDRHFNQARLCRTQDCRRTGNLCLRFCCTWDG